MAWEGVCGRRFPSVDSLADRGGDRLAGGALVFLGVDAQELENRRSDIALLGFGVDLTLRRRAGAGDRKPDAVGAGDLATVSTPVFECAAAAVVRGDDERGAAAIFLHSL